MHHTACTLDIQTNAQVNAKKAHAYNDEKIGKK